LRFAAGISNQLIAFAIVENCLVDFCMAKIAGVVIQGIQ
jgi:hypothetical protein